jgi:hypothetical protein
VLPQDANVGSLLHALRERLQILEAGGASPLQLRLLLQNGCRLNKLLKPGDSLKYGLQGGAYNRDALLDKSLYYRREGKCKILLEAIPQVHAEVCSALLLIVPIRALLCIVTL